MIFWVILRRWWYVSCFLCSWFLDWFSLIWPIHQTKNNLSSNILDICISCLRALADGLLHLPLCDSLSVRIFKIAIKTIRIAEIISFWMFSTRKDRFLLFSRLLHFPISLRTFGIALDFRRVSYFRTFTFYLMFYPSQALREKVRSQNKSSQICSSDHRASHRGVWYPNDCYFPGYGGIRLWCQWFCKWCSSIKNYFCAQIDPVLISSSVVQLICVMGNITSVATLATIVACGVL